MRELRPEIGAVGRGALLDPGAERAGGLEDAGVFGEQAEQQAHQQHFERMALVARRLEGVVQLAHALGGLDVDRVLRRDGLGAVTGDEGEMLDALVQVGEFEFLSAVPSSRSYRRKRAKSETSTYFGRSRSLMPGK